VSQHRPSRPDNIQVVESAADLHDVCGRLAAHPWIALDTEFMRESSYYPQLCYVQLAIPDRVYLIDPLALEDLDPLFAILTDAGIEKVIHSARQDLEAIYRRGGAVAAPIFDTQLAANFLGLPEQISYAGLVQAKLGLHLPKDHSRTDWTARPLTAEQIDYAVDDVAHLAALYPGMRAEMEERGRLAWLEEERAGIARALDIHVEPDTAWMRVGALQRLSGARLAVGQALAAWREETAQQQDLPRKWVLDDDSLVAIARSRPRSEADLNSIRGLNSRTRKRYGAAIIQVVADSVDHLPRGTLPVKEALRHDQRAVLDLLMAVVRVRAVQLHIAPSLLVRRDDLENWLKGEGDPAFLTGWRRDAIGGQLLEVRAGAIGLFLQKDALILRKS
jgi:ribonuclease D